MLDGQLKLEIEELIRETIQRELKLFYDNEIPPLRQRLEELEQGGPHELEASPILKASQSPNLSSTRSNSSLKSFSSASSSSNLLQKVSSKVASTASSLLHGNSDGDAVSRDVSPINSPIFSGTDDISLIGANSDTTTKNIGGPVTVRRNSGVTRVTNNHETPNDLVIPASLQEGIPFLRITHSKKVQRLLRINKDAGIITWNTKQSSRLFIDRICEIYVGEEARNYREEFRVSSELSQRWVTIIHQRVHETKLRALHLIISNQQDFELFVSNLFKLVKFRREIMSGLALAGKHFVDVHWSLNSSSSERLTFSQVLRLARQLHIHSSRHHIRAIFDEADKDNSHYLDFEEFREFVRLLKHRADIASIYQQYRIGESTTNLVNFFEKVQHQNLPTSLQLPLTTSPTVEEFEQLLLSSSSALKGSLERDPPNLSLPLNNYFICSSHNTYLMGRQVADESSIESCIRALQDGCRCIELDCWDGPPNSLASPVVYHGHGLTRFTSSVVFSDVIEAVLKYAFISTPFPLILSLEIRCNESSQLRIVSILRTILSRLLVTEPLPEDDGINLPSPDMLKHRILVKVKSASLVESSSGDEGSGQEPIKHTSICPALAELGVYFSGKRFMGTFTGNESRNTVYSFSERTLRGIVRDQEKSQLLETYNRDHFSRVYPSSYRLTSTNFDPIFYWKRGVQLVALNWQKFDLGMQLNTAFFSNRVGYVLKPDFMRSIIPNNSECLNDGNLHRGRKLEILIISAQQLPRPKFLKENNPFSPHIAVEAFGIGSGDTLGLAPQWKTPAVFDNGFNPIWNYRCEFSIQPEDYEFVCLRFTLAVEGQPFAYHTCRVACLRPGYRHVPLSDLYGEDFLFSSLFIKTELSLI